MGNESLLLAAGGLLLGLVAWAFSKIFDRTTEDIECLRAALAEVRSKAQDLCYRVGSLEKAAGSRRAHTED